MCISPQRHAILRHLNRQKWSKHAVFCTFLLSHVHFATAACNFATSKQTKVVQTCGVLYILTFKCAFRHSFVQFFDIWTDKSAPKPSCFVYFHLRMCFSPQRHAIFSTSEQTKVLQGRHVLYILTFKCAFRHSGVQFLISPLSTDLRTRRFNRPTFRLTQQTNHWKNTAFRDFSNIWRGCIFFLLTFALLHLLSTDLATLLRSYASAFQLSILSEVSI